MVNQVLLVGHVGRDAEERTFPNGGKVVTFNLATDESWKDKNGEWQKATEWHRCVVMGKPAEFAAQKIQKGAVVFVQGKVKTRTYESQGEKKSITEIVVSTYRRIDKPADGNGGYQRQQGGYQPQQQSFPSENVPDAVLFDAVPF